MVEGSATLVVDLGNSETRVLTQFGTNSKGKPKSRLVKMDNAYGVLPENKLDVYLSNGIYTEEDSTIFRHETPDGNIWCNGEICLSELQIVDRPTALAKKYELGVTKLTLINAFRKGIESVADISDVENEDVNVKWNVVMLLPPEHVDDGAKQLADVARSIKGIEFLMPKLKKEIIIEDIKVLPEGFCAYIAALFLSKSQVRQSHAYLADPTETTLIIDIGAGTTDFTLAKGNKIVTSSRFTAEIGGNNVHRLLGRLLKGQGISMPETALRKSVISGKIKKAGKMMDVRQNVNEARKNVSKMLVDAVREFFEASMMPIQSVNNVLVCGGGAVESTIEGIDSMGDYIISYFKELSPDVSLVETPCDEQGNQISPRDMNIIGAGILAS